MIKQQATLTQSIPYVHLSTTERSRLCKEVQTRIREAEPGLLGDRPFDTVAPNTSWLTCYFLSKVDPLRFYRCQIQTTRLRYIRQVRNAVAQLAWRKGISRRNWSAVADIGLAEWKDQEMRRIANAGEIEVFEEVSLDFESSYGVGVFATLDEEYLTMDGVRDFISRFLVHERGYKNPLPRQFASSQISDWNSDHAF